MSIAMQEPPTNPDQGPHYVHDREQCEAIARRVGVLLSRGNYDGAFHSLRVGIEEELLAVPDEVADISIHQLLDGKDHGHRTACTLESKLGALFVRDLAGVTAADLHSLPNYGDVTHRELVGALSEVGLRFPFGVHDLPETPVIQIPGSNGAFTVSQPASTPLSIVDVITNAGPAELAKIDAAIKEHEDAIAKLKRSGRATATKPTSTATTIIAYIRKNGPAEVADLCEELGLSPRSVGMAATMNKSLSREGNTISLAGGD